MATVGQVLYTKRKSEPGAFDALNNRIDQANNNWLIAKYIVTAVDGSGNVTRVRPYSVPDSSPIVTRNLVYDLNPTSDKVLTTGSLIDAVLDSSNSGNTATSAGSARPSYIRNARNGLPGISFASFNSNNLTLTSTISLTGDFTRFIVVNRDNPGGFRFYLGHTSSNSLEGFAPPDDFVVRVVTGGSSDARKFPINISGVVTDPVVNVVSRDASNNVFWRYKPSISVSITSVSDYSPTVAGTVLATTSTPHNFATGDSIIISGTTDYNGTFTVTRVTDTTFYFSNTFTSSQTGSAVFNELMPSGKSGTENITTIGSRGSGFFWNGRIYRILIYNRLLSSTEITATLNHLNNLYSLF